MENEPKIIMWATSNNGDGFVTKVGTYDSIEEIDIFTNVYNNVKLSFEYEIEDREKE